VWYVSELGQRNSGIVTNVIAQVHVGTPVDQCVANNDARLRRDEAKQKDGSSPQEVQSICTEDISSKPEESNDDEEAYTPELLNNLIFRYEEPSTHSRWDKPLFTVPWSDAEPPVADIFQALSGVVLPSAESTTETPVSNLTQSLASSTLSDLASTTTSGRAFNRGQSTRPKIIPHQATVQAVATDSGALYAMEKRTTAVVNAIRAFTQANPSAEVALAQSTHQKGIAIEVPESSIPVLIPAHVATTGTTDELAGAGGILALPKLQRMRRQWISLNRRYIGHGHGAGQGSLAIESVGDAFVRFLNHEFGGVENTDV
jgi:protein KTI12